MLLSAEKERHQTLMSRYLWRRSAVYPLTDSNNEYRQYVALVYHGGASKANEQPH